MLAFLLLINHSLNLVLRADIRVYLMMFVAKTRRPSGSTPYFSVSRVMHKRIEYAPRSSYPPVWVTG